MDLIGLHKCVNVMMMFDQASIGDLILKDRPEGEAMLECLGT